LTPPLAKIEGNGLAVLFYMPHCSYVAMYGVNAEFNDGCDSFVNYPTPTIPILEYLKNDLDLYVRRSVANHVGDIAKDNLELALNLCERWLKNASPELKWVIRHAVRNPFKKGNKSAILLRKLAK